MSLTFYFAPMSTATVTQAVIAELGIPCKQVVLNLQLNETSKPDFLKINPNGRVPAIVHDGTAIWESAAITIYLGEVFGVKAKLYPELGTKRGEALKWIAWSNVTLAEAAGRLAYALPTGTSGATEPNSLDWVPAEQRTAGVLEKAKSDLTSCFKILDDGLEGKAFLLGDYSLVDTHLYIFVGWIESMGKELKPFPNITNSTKRCAQRPALTKLMAEGNRF